MQASCSDSPPVRRRCGGTMCEFRQIRVRVVRRRVASLLQVFHCLHLQMRPFDAIYGPGTTSSSESISLPSPQSTLLQSFGPRQSRQNQSGSTLITNLTSTALNEIVGAPGVQSALRMALDQVLVQFCTIMITAQ